MGVKSKHSYQYDLVNDRGNCIVMMVQKSIMARFYQLKLEHELTAQYLR
jgi:hypothetical protein